MDQSSDSHCYDAEYELAVRALLNRAQTVLCLPSLMGDSYGAMISATRSLPASTRILGWAHLDSPYELRVLEHYEPAIHRFVGVSSRLASLLADRLPHRKGDICRIPYGTEVPPATPDRQAGVLHLAYVGRLDDDVKRVSLLPLLSDALTARGVNHSISVAGDGPARQALERAASTRPSLRILGGLPPRHVETLYASARFLILPSRTEGLALVLQEAMALGCIPIAVDTPSGTRELIDPLRTGMLVTETESLPLLAEHMADAVIRALQCDPAAMSRAARQHIADNFDARTCLTATLELFASCVDDLQRTWCPLETSFTAIGDSGSGTVPPDAATRMDSLLTQLSNCRVLIYGTGNHSRALGAVLERHAAQIVGFIDDDASRAGTTFLRRPVMTPSDLAVEATDVVLSSWIHQSDLWTRRHVLENAGLRVHRLYEASTASTR
jgi:hypothetical protein